MNDRSHDLIGPENGEWFTTFLVTEVTQQLTLLFQYMDNGRLTEIQQSCGKNESNDTLTWRFGVLSLIR